MKGRARRYARRVQVRFWPEVDPDRSYAGYSHNISATGMFIATIHPFRPGTRVVVEMQAEGGEEFTVKATVAHSAKVSPLLQAVRPSGMGVRFTGHSPGLEGLLPEQEFALVKGEEVKPFYPVYFSDLEELLLTVERDIRNGGLFVPTARPAPMDHQVAVELKLPRAGYESLVFDAKVVHRIGSGPNMGIGIAFLRPQEVLTRLESLIAEMQRG